LSFDLSLFFGLDRPYAARVGRSQIVVTTYSRSGDSRSIERAFSDGSPTPLPVKVCDAVKAYFDLADLFELPQRPIRRLAKQANV
jgi:hypothetical protein